MKINYFKEPSLSEDYVDVHYRQECETIGVVKDFFFSFHSIMGKKDNCIQKLHPGTIFYLEVVDRKLFAYQERNVFHLDYSLKSFLERFGAGGFIQIGKSTAVNIYKVNRVKADLNMRLRLVLDNGEFLILNRSYKKCFLEALKRIKEVTYETDKQT